jgi:hypothetical protein
MLSATAMASVLVALWFITQAIGGLSYDLRPKRLNANGIPNEIGDQLRTLVLGLTIVAAGIAAIDQVKGDVPLWGSALLPLLFLYFTVVYFLGELSRRKTFTFKRFRKVVVSPLMATLAPVGPVVLRHSADVVRLAGHPGEWVGHLTALTG